MVSYEIIGNKEKAVAIIESSNLLKKDKKFASEIVKKIKSVQSVLVKTSKRYGILRKRKYKLLLGNKNTEIIHSEHNSLLKLDPQKVYFSPRELTERQKIAHQARQREKILVLFSGIGPYIIAIKKVQPSTTVYGIELNKYAHQYAKENIKLNKLENVVLIHGNVKKEVPRLKLKFDRIIMPLPKTAGKYLSLAFKKIKNNGIINYYTWGKDEDYDSIKAEIKMESEKIKKKIKILNITKVLPYAPKVYKLRVDIKCLK